MLRSSVSNCFLVPLCTLGGSSRRTTFSPFFTSWVTRASIRWLMSAFHSRDPMRSTLFPSGGLTTELPSPMLPQRTMPGLPRLSASASACFTRCSQVAVYARKLRLL